MADAIQTLPLTRQALIAAVVQRELQFQAKMTGFITDLSMFAEDGSKSVDFPKLTSFTAVNRAFGAAGDATALTESVDTMLLDQNLYVAWLVDSSSEVQSRIPFQSEAAKRAASAIGRNFDSTILGVLESDGAATATAGAITQAIILEMLESIMDAEAREDNLVLTVGNGSYTDMLAISDFVKADSFGSGAQSGLRTGVIGEVFGIEVVRHSGIAASSYYLHDKDGVGYAFQKAPSMSSQKANEYGVNAERHAMDMLAGVKSLQGGNLIIKDGNV